MYTLNSFLIGISSFEDKRKAKEALKEKTQNCDSMPRAWLFQKNTFFKWAMFLVKTNEEKEGSRNSSNFVKDVFV